MECTYLGEEEKYRSKKLYREIFSQDSEEFVDLYYKTVGHRNKILGMKGSVNQSQWELIAMLHQNPHTVRIHNRTEKIEYIYGVAVSPKYRKKGYMKQMMVHALGDMYERGHCFTYLFPVKKGLYESCGFGYTTMSSMVCDQDFPNPIRLGKLFSYSQMGGSLEKIEQFVRQYYAAQPGICMEHSGGYIEEWMRFACLESENGNIYVYVEDKMIKAVLKVAGEEMIEEIGTPEYLEKAIYLWRQSILKKGKQEQTREEEQKKEEELPAMVRILHMEELLEWILFPRELKFTVFVKDDMFEENEGTYRLENGKMKRVQEVCQKKMDIAEFTEWLFSIVPFRIRDQI